MTAWARSGMRDDARQEDLPQRRRQRTGGAVVAGHEQLLDEEGVAIGPPMDPLDEVADGGSPRIALEQVARVGRVEPDEVDPLDPAAAVDLGEPWQQRVTAVQLVRPEGHDQEDPIRRGRGGRGTRRSRGSPDRPSAGPRRRRRPGARPTRRWRRPRSASSSRAWSDSRLGQPGSTAMAARGPGRGARGRAAPSRRRHRARRDRARWTRLAGPRRTARTGCSPSPTFAQPPKSTRIPRADATARPRRPAVTCRRRPRRR